MRKFFCLALLFAISGCAQLETVGNKLETIVAPNNPASFVGTSRVTIYVVNKSSWPLLNLSAWMADENEQLQRDFLPYWQIDAELVLANNPPPGAPRLVFQNGTRGLDATAGGTHLDNVALVSYDRNSGTDHLAVGIAASHEVLEMLVDPRNNGKEICDPVEQNNYGASGSVPWLSNFVTPAWYPGGLNPPQVPSAAYDFLRLLSAPRTYTTGGRGGYGSLI